MHSVLIAGSFIAMVLSPCVVASCSKYFPMRLRIRIVGSRRQRSKRAHAAPPESLDRLLRVVRPGADVRAIPPVHHSR